MHRRIDRRIDRRIGLRAGVGTRIGFGIELADLDPFIGAEPVGLHDRLPVHEHPTLFNQGLHSCPGQAKHAGKGRIQSFAHESGRNREGAAHRSPSGAAGSCDAEPPAAGSSPSGSSESGTPRQARKIMAIAAKVIDMSAMLKIGKFGRPMKSTTDPMPGDGGLVSRSIRLPSSPPRSPPSASAHGTEVMVRENRMMTTPTITAMVVN